MARIVRHEGKAPKILRTADIDDDELFLCRCGLSATFPLCDDSHLATKGEDGGLYRYERNAAGDLERVAVRVEEA